MTLDTITNTRRAYTRINGDHEETVFVHVTPDGYIRMTAANLHEVLTHIGFTPTTEPQ